MSATVIRIKIKRHSGGNMSLQRDDERGYGGFSDVVDDFGIGAATDTTFYEALAGWIAKRSAEGSSIQIVELPSFP